MREALDNFFDWLGDTFGPQFDNLQFEIHEVDLRDDLCFGRDRLTMADLHRDKPNRTLN